MKLRILRGAKANPRERGVIALAADDGAWVMVNLSTAVALELCEQHALPRATGLSLTNLAGVILTDAHVDHTGGLLSLRIGAPLELYATSSVFESLTSTLPVLTVLDHYCGVHWHLVPVAGDRRVAQFQVNSLPSLEFVAIATDVQPPPYAANSRDPAVGDTLALTVRDLSTGQSMFCAPGLTQIGAFEFDWMRQADCLLMDAPASSHALPVDSLAVELLSGLPARHKVLWPSQRDGAEPVQSPTAPAGRGIEWAYDGLEIEL